MIESPSEILDQLTLRQPWWLLLLLIPLIVIAMRRLQPRGTQHRQRLAKLIDPKLWNWLLTHPDNPYRSAIAWPLLLAWGLIAIAASGPHFSNSSEGETARSIDIAIVVDISPSMAADDIAPTRLERAKLELKDFTARLKSDRTALIAYSANAYRMLPLTADRNTLHHFSDALDIALTRKRGSNLTQALEIAIQQLDHSEKAGRAIVLITDGESHNPQADLAVAKRLSKKGMPLLILGLGTETGGMVPDEGGRRLHHDGEPVISRIDKKILQRLATTSGGIYTTVSNDDRDWDTIFRALDQLEPLNRYQVPYQPQQFQFFPWLMAAAIALFLFNGFREQRKGIALVLLTPLILTVSPTSEASSIVEQWRESKAFNALEQGKNSEAAYLYSEINSYNGQLGFGVAAYRQQEWQLAADAFSRALQLAENDRQRARALYNHGNALIRLGWLDTAAQAFQDALRYQSNFPRAALNLNLVNEARAQQGGVQRQKRNQPQQASPQSTHDSNATRASAQLKRPEQQSDQQRRQLKAQSDNSVSDSNRDADSSEQPPTKQSSRNSDSKTINWNNALQQAQAIDQRFGHQLMRQRFMAQEAEMEVKVSAEEKPW